MSLLDEYRQGTQSHLTSTNLNLVNSSNLNPNNLNRADRGNLRDLRSTSETTGGASSSRRSKESKESKEDRKKERIPTTKKALDPDKYADFRADFAAFQAKYAEFLDFQQPSSRGSEGRKKTRRAVAYDKDGVLRTDSTESQFTDRTENSEGSPEALKKMQRVFGNRFSLFLVLSKKCCLSCWSCFSAEVHSSTPTMPLPLSEQLLR